MPKLVTTLAPSRQSEPSPAAAAVMPVAHSYPNDKAHYAFRHGERQTVAQQQQDISFSLHMLRNAVPRARNPVNELTPKTALILLISHEIFDFVIRQAPPSLSHGSG
jgi:hypothetical protein